MKNLVFSFCLTLFLGVVIVFFYVRGRNEKAEINQTNMKVGKDMVISSFLNSITYGFTDVEKEINTVLDGVIRTSDIISQNTLVIRLYDGIFNNFSKPQTD
jgi:hypothetical protein